MTISRDLKLLVRSRMEKTGERYMTALRHLQGVRDGESSIPTAAVEKSPSISWNPLIETTVKEARELLARALEHEPRLTHFGIGVFEEGRRRQEAAKSGNGIDAINREFQEERLALAKHLDEIAACADWIKRQRRIVSFNLKHTSYGYKHLVERWFAGRGPYQYVANGSFIAAALGLGFDGMLSSPDSPNLHFQLSQRTVKQPLE